MKQKIALIDQVAVKIPTDAKYVYKDQYGNWFWTPKKQNKEMELKLQPHNKEIA